MQTTYDVHDAHPFGSVAFATLPEEVNPIDPHTPDVERELSLLARHHMNSAARTPERILDRSGYTLLSRLEHGPLTLKQLAEIFRLDQSTVNRQVKALRRDALVERIADPDGGLAQLLRPTESGLQALANDREIGQEQVGRVLEGWSKKDVEALARLLRKFNGSIEVLEGSAWPRSE